mmetsp:Transcript_6130/g.13754  ORF Transcript_6130/g.13754 Transcript_6130/m.13754 type:complete len:245 (-) Transcript_6130:465-1199(-)
MCATLLAASHSTLSKSVQLSTSFSIVSNASNSSSTLPIPLSESSFMTLFSISLYPDKMPGNKLGIGGNGRPLAAPAIPAILRTINEAFNKGARFLNHWRLSSNSIGVSGLASRCVFSQTKNIFHLQRKGFLRSLRIRLPFVSIGSIHRSCGHGIVSPVASKRKKAWARSILLSRVLSIDKTWVSISVTCLCPTWLDILVLSNLSSKRLMASKIFLLLSFASETASRTTLANEFFHSPNCRRRRM